MTKEEIIDFCEMKSQLEPENEDIFNYIIKALELKQKTGHWITENMSDGDVAYRCSKCNELFWLECGTPKDNKYNFCPKCGERLIEPHESGDNE